MNDDWEVSKRELMEELGFGSGATSQKVSNHFYIALIPLCLAIFDAASRCFIPIAAWTSSLGWPGDASATPALSDGLKNARILKVRLHYDAIINWVGS